MSGFCLSLDVGSSGLGGFTLPAASSEHLTVVANGFDWAWPNPGETQFLTFANSSWMVVGMSLEIDDGVQIPGILTIVHIYDTEDGIVVECAWTAVGPPGGTMMLDGAAVALVIP